MGVIPTVCFDAITKYDSLGKAIFDSSKFLNKITYQKRALQALHKKRIKIGLGADYFGETVEPEISALVSYRIFSPREIIDIWGRSTSQMIFPGRKIGEIREGYEASFLVLDDNPFLHFETIKNIRAKIKEGKILPQAL